MVCILPGSSGMGGKSFHLIRLLFSILGFERDSATGASFPSASRPSNQNNYYWEKKADKASDTMLLTCLYLGWPEADVNYHAVRPETENSLITAWPFGACLLMLSAGSCMSGELCVFLDLYPYLSVSISILVVGSVSFWRVWIVPHYRWYCSGLLAQGHCWQQRYWAAFTLDV